MSPIVVSVEPRKPAGYITSFKMGLNEVRCLLSEPRCEFGYTCRAGGRDVTYRNGGYVVAESENEADLQNYLKWLSEALRKYNERTLAYYGMAWRHYYELRSEVTERSYNKILDLFVSELYIRRRGGPKRLIGKPISS